MRIILSRFHKRNAYHGENILFVHTNCSVCLCVRARVCARACVCVRVCVSARVCACARVYECVYTQTLMSVHVHVRASMCVCSRVQVRARVSSCKCQGMRVWVCASAIVHECECVCSILIITTCKFEQNPSHGFWVIRKFMHQWKNSKSKKAQKSRKYQKLQFQIQLSIFSRYVAFS